MGKDTRKKTKGRQNVQKQKSKVESLQALGLVGGILLAVVGIVLMNYVLGVNGNAYFQTFIRG